MLHFKELGDTESVVRNAVYVFMCLIVVYVPSDALPLCHECSCSSARRVSNLNSNVLLGDNYPHIKLYCNALRIDNVIL